MEVYVVLYHEGKLGYNPHTVELVGVFESVDMAKKVIENNLGDLELSNFANVAGTLSYVETTESGYVDYQITKERVLCQKL